MSHKVLHATLNLDNMPFTKTFQASLTKTFDYFCRIIKVLRNFSFVCSPLCWQHAWLQVNSKQLNASDLMTQYVFCCQNNLYLIIMLYRTKIQPYVTKPLWTLSNAKNINLWERSWYMGVAHWVGILVINVNMDISSKFIL